MTPNRLEQFSDGIFARLIFAFFLPIASYLIYWVMIVYFLTFSAIENLSG